MYSIARCFITNGNSVFTQSVQYNHDEENDTLEVCINWSMSA